MGMSRLGQEPSTAPAQPVQAPSRLLLQDVKVLGKWGGQGWVLGPVRAGEGMEGDEGDEEEEEEHFLVHTS